MIRIPGFPKFPIKQLQPGTQPNGKGPVLNGAPVIFSAQANLAANKQVVLNAQTLQSGFRTPYFIDEIHFSLVTSRVSNVAQPIADLNGLSGLVRAQFQTGKHYFSTDAVPVGLYAPVFSLLDCGEVEAGETAGVRHRRWYSSVRWKLPAPLFMPAGDTVLANLSLVDDLGIIASIFGTDTAINATITYSGRIVGQGHRATKRDVPWVAWWQKALSTPSANSQTRFRNPFMVPAHVQRFTERTYQYRYDAAAPTSPLRRFDEVNSVYQMFQSAGGGAAYHTISIDDSRGYSIVPRQMPIGDVFDASRHAWTFGRELTAREQFNMTMTTQNFSALAAPVGGFTNIGLVGYREENP